MPGARRDARTGRRWRRSRATRSRNLPPHGPAAQRPDHRLLDRPAIDVEAIGQVAEARRRDHRKPRVERQPQCQIAAEQRKQRDELAQLDAEGETGQGHERHPTVEDAGRAQFVEHHAGGKKAEHPAPSAEEGERIEAQAGDAEGEQQQGHRQGQQPGHAEPEHHQIHDEFGAQGRHRAVDLEPGRIVDEHHPWQLVHHLIEQCVADDELVGLRPAEIDAGLQGGDQRRQHESRNEGGDEQAGENPQCPLGRYRHGSAVCS